MPETYPIVFVVDNNSSVRDALNRLIRSVGLDLELFGSAQEFLRWRRSRAPACIVMDVRLVTENTVKAHRSRGMEKMQAQSLAELVKMMERLMLAIEKAS